MLIHRRFRRFLRRHWVDRQPEHFRWVARLLKRLYPHRRLPGLAVALRVLHRWLVPAQLYEQGRLGPADLPVRLRVGDAIQAEIYYQGCFEPELVPWFQRYLRPHATVLDVGAHCGQFALIASRSQPGVRVLAFEPDRDNAADLEHNLAANELRNVQVRRVAVADRAGQLPLYSDDETFGFSDHSLARGAGIFAGRAEMVEAITLDSLLAELEAPVCLIKMDIEGAELLALRGARRLLAAHQPALLLEVDARWMLGFDLEPETLRAWLAEQGYSCSAIDEHGRLQPVVSGVAACSANWVALPNGQSPER